MIEIGDGQRVGEVHFIDDDQPVVFRTFLPGIEVRWKVASTPKIAKAIATETIINAARRLLRNKFLQMKRKSLTKSAARKSVSTLSSIHVSRVHFMKATR